MDAFLKEVGAFLIQQGPFAIAAGVEGAAVIYLFLRLMTSLEARIKDKNDAAELAHRRAEILEKLANDLLERRKR